MSDSSFFTTLLCLTVHKLFRTWQELALATISDVHSKIEESICLTQAIKVEPHGNMILTLLFMAMRLEQVGIAEIHNSIAVMVSDDQYLSNAGQSSLWIAGMDTELQANMQDEMASMARALRKRYCNYYAAKINQQIRKYFRGQHWSQLKDEPRDIKSEFFEIAKYLREASQQLDIFMVGVVIPKKQPRQTVTGGGTPGGPTSLKKPELLVKTKKFNQMEMEMDKFLAKK